MGENKSPLIAITHPIILHIWWIAASDKRDRRDRNRQMERQHASTLRDIANQISTGMYLRDFCLLAPSTICMMTWWVVKDFLHEP